jgi:hypothetical protein
MRKLIATLGTLLLLTAVALPDRSGTVVLREVDLDAKLILSDERSYNLLQKLEGECRFKLPGGEVQVNVEARRIVVSWPGLRTPKKLKVDSGGSRLTLKGMAGGGEDFKILFIKHPRHGLYFAANGRALEGRVGSCRVLLLDMNLDGRYGDRRKDAVVFLEGKKLWVTPSMRVMPLPGEWGGFKVDQKARTLKLRKQTLGSKREYREAVTVLNEARRLVGVRSCSWDPELSDGCEAHCAYLARHGFRPNPHSEDSGKSGYSDAGLRAAKHSCIGTTGNRPAAEFAHVCMAMFYHRLPLIQPGTWLVGVMRADGFEMLDGVTGRRREDFPPPLVYPIAGQFDVPREFNDSEIPSPVPSGTVLAGYPITLDFGWGASPREVKAELLMGIGEMRVPVAVTWPAKPASDVRPNNDNSILILPKKILEPHSRYRVKVSYQLSDDHEERDWIFYTGEERFGATWREVR